MRVTVIPVVVGALGIVPKCLANCLAKLKFQRNYRLIGLVDRVFANGPVHLGFILGHVIPKTFKKVLNTSLLSTQQYKVRIKGKVEQSREKNSDLPYTSV